MTPDHIAEIALLEISRVQREAMLTTLPEIIKFDNVERLGVKRVEKKVVYQSSRYEPELVTGVYIRCNGRKPNYTFRVFEAATGTGRFAGKPGMGGTLREYDCDGSEIPADIRDEAIRTKQTVKWS